MKSYLDDIKKAWEYGNQSVRFCLVAGIIGLFFAALLGFSRIIGFGNVSNTIIQVLDSLALSPNLKSLIYKPWSFFTYPFATTNLFSIFFNLLGVYWISSLVCDLIGYKSFVPILISGIVGGATLCLLTGFFTSNGDSTSGYFGVFMAFLMVLLLISFNYTISLVLLGSFPVKWLALVLISFELISFLNSGSSFNAMSLGGALGGIVYGYSLKNNLNPVFSNIFSYNKVKPNVIPIKTKEHNSNIYQIDIILEKIKKEGITSLSVKEKEFLDRYSQNVRK